MQEPARDSAQAVQLTGRVLGRAYVGNRAEYLVTINETTSLKVESSTDVTVGAGVRGGAVDRAGGHGALPAEPAMNAPAGIAATLGERTAGSARPASGCFARPSIARLGIPPVVFYALLAALLAVLVLYPFAVLLTSSFFTGQPGRLGNFTLANYAVWLGSWDLLPIMLNSVIFSASRLAIGLFFALLFAWAVARTNVPFAGLMGWMIPIPFFVPDLLTGIRLADARQSAERRDQPAGAADSSASRGRSSTSTAGAA